MRVNVLGPLQVVVDGAPVEVRGKRLRWLLLRLAMEPGRVVPAERLIADLWPDEPPVDGPAALWRGAAFEDAPFAVDEAVRLALLRDDLAGWKLLPRLIRWGRTCRLD